MGNALIGPSLTLSEDLGTHLMMAPFAHISQMTATLVAIPRN